MATLNLSIPAGTLLYGCSLILNTGDTAAVVGGGLSGSYAACAYDGSSEGPRIVLDSRMDEARLVLNGGGGRR